MNALIENLIKQYRGYNLSEVIDYDKFNDYAIVHHSSSIEGSTLSEIETRLLLEEDITPKGKPLEHSLMTKDHYAALKLIAQEGENKSIITPQFIQELNARIMKSTGAVYNTVFGTIDASKGMFRKGNVSAGGSYFVNYEKVEDLVGKLSDKINSRLQQSDSTLERLDVSFMAHFHLVSIHPFYDGNGRTSRLLMNYVQKICDLPLAIVHKEDKADYFNALQQTRKKDDFNIFKDFMYGQYEKYLKEEIRKYQEILPSDDQDLDKGGNYSFIF